MPSCIGSVILFQRYKRGRGEKAGPTRRWVTGGLSESPVESEGGKGRKGMKRERQREGG